MKPSKSRFDPMVGIAESQEKKAARNLADMQLIKRSVLQQINQLKSYRDEYSREWVSGKQMTPEMITDRQVFLSRLNRSIELLEGQLQQVSAKHGRLQKHWQASRVRLQSLQKAAENELLKYRMVHARRERIESDEIAQRTGSDVRQRLSRDA